MDATGHACAHVQRWTTVRVSNFYKVSKIVKLTEAESRMMVARGWREAALGSYCLNGTNFQLCKMNKF